jgi:hypothetical protein
LLGFHLPCFDRFLPRFVQFLVDLFSHPLFISEVTPGF